MHGGQAPEYLSTEDAAAALGVSVSTIKRWVDEEILPAHRTAGGHRKLLRAEVLALSRHGELPLGDLAALSPNRRRASFDLDSALVNLHRALLHGQAAEANSLIRLAYHSGLAIEALADRLIAPAMVAIGHDWETSKIDVWHEHRATQICAAALYALRGELAVRAEKNRPLAVGGTPEGDPYLLANLLAEYVLLDAGWDVVNLGPNTPMPSFIKAVKELRPKLLWISVSYLADEAAFVASYRDLYRLAERNGVAVAVGGNELRDAVRTAIPYTTHGDGLAHLAAFARTLHPRPKPPRRGRPVAGA